MRQGSQGAHRKGWGLGAQREREGDLRGPIQRAGVSRSLESGPGSRDLERGRGGSRYKTLPPLFPPSMQSLLRPDFYRQASPLTVLGSAVSRGAQALKTAPCGWEGGLQRKRCGLGRAPGAPTTSLRRDGPAMVWTELRSLCE